MPKNADANVTTTLVYLGKIISAKAIVAMINYFFCILRKSLSKQVGIYLLTILLTLSKG